MTREQQYFLESHRASLHFDIGKKIALEIRRRSDGLRMQFSDFTLDSVIEKAKAELRRQEEEKR